MQILKTLLEALPPPHVTILPEKEVERVQTLSPSTLSIQ